jgi:hypothetical protein
MLIFLSEYKPNLERLTVRHGKLGIFWSCHLNMWLETRLNFIVWILTFDRSRINKLHHFLYKNNVTSDSHFILSTLSTLTSKYHLSIKYRHRMHIIQTLVHIKEAFVLRTLPWLSPPYAIIFYQIPSNVSRCPTLKSWQTDDWKETFFP